MGPQQEGPNPLDVEQRFADASSHEVRDELQDLVVRDLLGPWEGERERFLPRAAGPRDRYLVGMLGPKHRARSNLHAADDASDIGPGIEGSDSEGVGELPEVLTPQSLGQLWASSMGLSFCLASGTEAVEVTAEWGRYTRQETEDTDGNTRTVWGREPETRSVTLRLAGRSDFHVPLTGAGGDDPGVYLAASVRPGGATRTIQLTLVNGQAAPRSGSPDPYWLFQPRLTVRAPDGSAIFLPVDDPLDPEAPPGEDPEEAHLRLLYRDQLAYATGHNVAVHATVEPDARRASVLETTWLPTYDVPATEAPSTDNPLLTGTELAMDALTEADEEALRDGLAPLSAGYGRWLDARETEIASLPGSLHAAATAAVFRARRAADRIQAGITLLTDPGKPGHAEALQAFRFANRAMALQRRHTEIAHLRDDTGLDYAAASSEVDARGAASASWRPFQLAFVLLNLPSLADPDHAERAAGSSATADLLFFPTGGGKTEAYLGLTAYTFAIRRLQGTLGSGERARDGASGVAVLMRYTLRLLTAQQFQRAAALVCAAEILRREDEDTWGSEPFRIGLWVGRGVSPNWFTDASDQIAQAREAGRGERVNVLQTLACPWCGTALQGHRDLHVDSNTRRVHLYCPNAEGALACPFSRTQSEEGLPILTVDEEIYRYAPSLVIATVDKLAQLPWKGYAGILFGRIQEYCPRHGYRHADLDRQTGCGSRHNRTARLPGVSSRPIVRLRPPDLIVQDELHLISGALGTIVGLFEAAVDELCTWTTPSGRRAAPKVVASTATTKRAREQVRGVFGRDLEIFPPQVTDIADTFFSRQVPVDATNPGRRYLGICAHGVRLKSAEIRLAEILLMAGQTMLDRYGDAADPYMTVVDYFNATRELAGMRRYLDDDVTTRVRRHGIRKGIADRLVRGTDMLAVQELTSRISSADISTVLKRLEIGFDPDLDTTARRRAIADSWRDVMAANRGKSQRSSDRVEPHTLARRWSERARVDRVPVDTVLATSMLQVGVDVARFGLMVVTGQPKNTAEYIQASSRIGRDSRRPGLVVTLYNWTRPRDLAHYEDFEHYHATFYRQVEALSVTPYTRRSLDRGAAATVVAAVRNVVESHSRNADAHDVDLGGDLVRGIVDRMLARAEAADGERGRRYFEERIARLADVWNAERGRSARLGYEKGRSATQLLVPLLRTPGDGPWLETTVGWSMRETENEVNLLLPGGGEIFHPLVGAPEWTFASPDDGVEPEDSPDGDEVGDSALDGADSARSGR